MLYRAFKGQNGQAIIVVLLVCILKRTCQYWVVIRSKGFQGSYGTLLALHNLQPNIGLLTVRTESNTDEIVCLFVNTAFFFSLKISYTFFIIFVVFL